jgi:peptide subunit release factor 1 (eRF1)
MSIQELGQRHERGTVLVTLSVSHDSNLNSVLNQIRKESATASKIRDKGTRKKVLKALKRLLHELSLLTVGNGFIAFAAYDGV